MTATILVVDDDNDFRRYVQRILQSRGYDTIGAADGIEALSMFQLHKPNLVILDLVMPYMDGLIVSREIRCISQCPIIILSGLENEARKVAAFDEGADDYVTKPFGSAELLARIKAILRRFNNKADAHRGLVVRTGELEIDIENNRVRRNEKLVRLTRAEINFIKILARHADQIVSHRTLLRRMWGPEYGKETEYLVVYIARLRRKLEKDPSHPRYIITEPGLGYRLNIIKTSKGS